MVLVVVVDVGMSVDGHTAVVGKGERAEGVNGLFLQLHVMYMLVMLLSTWPQGWGCPW